MSTDVVSVRVDKDLKRRLEDLSAATGRPVTYYVREAVEDKIDELEYAYSLRSEAESIRQGRTATISSAELAAELFE